MQGRNVCRQSTLYAQANECEPQMDTENTDDLKKTKNAQVAEIAKKSLEGRDSANHSPV